MLHEDAIKKAHEISDSAEDDEEKDPLIPVRTGPKVGRNAPCPCGSGKNYKKCCIDRD